MLKLYEDCVYHIKNESSWYINCRIWFSASICCAFAIIGTIDLNNFSKRTNTTYYFSRVFTWKWGYWPYAPSAPSPPLPPHIKLLMCHFLLSSPSFPSQKWERVLLLKWSSSIIPWSHTLPCAPGLYPSVVFFSNLVFGHSLLPPSAILHSLSTVLWFSSREPFPFPSLVHVLP